MSYKKHLQTKIPEGDGIWIAQEIIDIEIARLDEIRTLNMALRELNSTPLLAGTTKETYKTFNDDLLKAKNDIVKKIHQLVEE